MGVFELALHIVYPVNLTLAVADALMAGRYMMLMERRKASVGASRTAASVPFWLGRNRTFWAIAAIWCLAAGLAMRDGWFEIWKIVDRPLWMIHHPFVLFFMLTATAGLSILFALYRPIGWTWPLAAGCAIVAGGLAMVTL